MTESNKAKAVEIVQLWASLLELECAVIFNYRRKQFL